MSKNKISIFIIIVLSLFFSYSPFAYAEEDNDSSTNSAGEQETSTSTKEDRQNYREKMREQWLEKKEQFKSEQEERKARILERKDEIVAKRCEEVLERIEKRIENYNDNKETHIDNYARLYEKLSDIASNLGEKGYDVSKLEADLVIFDVMVKEYASAYSAFIGKLEAAQEYTCGESEGMFKQLVQESKDQLKMAVEKRQSIREFYSNTLRKDIQDIRMQKVESRNSIEGSENE